MKISAVIFTNYINGLNITSVSSSDISSNSYNFISNDSLYNYLKLSKLISDSLAVKNIDLREIESKILEIPYVDEVLSFIDIESNFKLELSLIHI